MRAKVRVSFQAVRMCVSFLTSHSLSLYAHNLSSYPLLYNRDLLTNTWRRYSPAGQ
jgi:hypothetical protein